MNLISKLLHFRLVKYLRKWHQKIGIIAAFFIIFLSITGVALNHTTTLSLTHKPIHNLWLLDHYSIASPTDIRFYQDNLLQVTNHLVWLDGVLLLDSSTEIVSIGAISPSVTNNTSIDLFIIASKNQLFLYNYQGELFDQLGAEAGIPEGIEALSINNNMVIVKTSAGYYQSDSNFFDWQLISPLLEPLWIKAELVSEQRKQQIALAYRSQFLTLERVILDAHSGRIFGTIGVLFMDAVALLLILLSLSGVYMWFQYIKAKR